MINKYLVEIGTEELPYKFIPSAMDQLKDSLAKTLEENRILYGDIKIYGTPRRLAVIIEDISELQPDLEKTIKGPPAKIAFDENNMLSKAGQGFAQKQNLKSEDLYKEEVDGIEYVFAKVTEKGKKTACVLQEIIPNIILSLQGSHFMRWADLDIKFSRPIRWIVSLINNEEVKITIGNVESSRQSRGHRFYIDDYIEINSPDSYKAQLYKANVIVDQKERKEEIIKLAKSTAESAGGQVHLDPDLLEEVTYILEWPVPVLGNFDKKYLAVPKDVLVTVMASHQRYFPIFASGNLLNHFITMANYDGGSLDNIRKGNERVIRARFDDAIFFYNEDTKRTLESRIEDLKGVTFQKGLGTVYDKVSRIREISYFISTEMCLDKKHIENIEKAATLSKADLVTNLVREFTELQGVIGSDYAKLNGENEEVVAGIREHYLPTSADGELAESLTGQIVGIADKIDTISGTFAVGKIPTGSADPLGLRRAAIGILLTVINKNLKVNLTSVTENAVSLQPVAIEDKAKLINDIREFIIQRLRIYLNENYRYDVVEAALGAKDPLADLNDVIERIKIISELVKRENYTAFHEAANRIIRMIKTESYKQTPDVSLFTYEIEKQLWDRVSNIGEISYTELVKELENMIPLIEKFFDEVLVMDPDLKIRENRLSLLGNVQSKFLNLADFSKIVA